MKEIKWELKSKSGIYCIINISNSKRYIGSSTNMWQRLQKHRSLLRHNKHDNLKLQNGWNKYEENNFDYYILEFCEKEFLEKREQFFIDTLKPEYNITLIVERNILSKESRILQSRTRKERIASGEIKFPIKYIYRYSLNGEFIEEHESLKTACEKLNISESSVCRFTNGTHKKGAGFLWSHEKLDSMPPYIKSRNDTGKLNKEVEVLNIETDNIDFEFKSLKECASFFGIKPVMISDSIKNKRIFRKKYRISLKCKK